ncbi:DEAD/DEAH box helicase [Nitrososphaera sp. AFS]|uniref:DEAD/DEAH box helicase n=1 Tax=Nitrososphaera sp. AFS TaxID=2301191 RepID=UPI0019170CB4|nr:DEAD/DEAH box helicase [Nitrososphaera sp. AFS]
MKSIVSRYRCPRCNIFNSINVNRIFDGRMLFSCSECNICAVVPKYADVDGHDSAYLEFLDLYDNGHVANSDDLNVTMQQERILRPPQEIDKLLEVNNYGSNNKLLRKILHSQQDYVVEYRLIQDSNSGIRCPVSKLSIDDRLVSILSKKGIKHIYEFQEESINNILLGEDVVLVAPTASGKTEAFCIPILQKISEYLQSSCSKSNQTRPIKGQIHAIFLYPTKALSRDQLPKIMTLAASLGISVDIFDGDTPREEKNRILSVAPQIIITNFDVLHYHLMHRTTFSFALRTSKFLVIDEAHVYTGIFGANIHYIVRRLERLCTNQLQIIAASATLPNAGQFCKALFGREMRVIRGEGRRGKVNFVMLFPSLRSNRSLVIDLVKQTTAEGHKTIAFNNSHLGSELLSFYLSRQGIKNKVHRAGLLPSVRRTVEQAFKYGKLMTISATPTLELGIDIGNVDAVISGIVPINRLTQRLGRAARRGQEGYAFLALGNDPISQYYCLHPDDYFADQEQVYTDPSNPFVQEYQILAMVCDKPISKSEYETDVAMSKTIQALVARGLIIQTEKSFVPNFKKAYEILDEYSIRGIGNTIDIFFSKVRLGERALPKAIEELHENAIYFLSGRRYQVRKLHYDTQHKEYPYYAELVSVPDDYPYYTKALVEEWPSIIEVHEQKRAFGIEVKYCSLKIQKKVTGYTNIEIGQETMQGKKIIFSTPIEFEFITKGFVFRAPRPIDILNDANDENYVEMSGYHASEHVLIEGSSMITGGASQDMGGVSLGSSGLIFIHDSGIGGNGASRALYDKFDVTMKRALAILCECPCKVESGCPRCTYSYRCGNNNEYLHKMAAKEVLDRAVSGQQTEIDQDIPADLTLV